MTLAITPHPWFIKQPIHPFFTNLAGVILLCLVVVGSTLFSQPALAQVNPHATSEAVELAQKNKVPKAPAANTPKKSKKPKNKNSGTKTTPKSSSDESRAERERRLKRECKGRHNAGACLGYTH